MSIFFPFLQTSNDQLAANLVYKPEVDEGWVALDVVLPADLGADGAVHLADAEAHHAGLPRKPLPVRLMKSIIRNG